MKPGIPDNINPLPKWTVQKDQISFNLTTNLRVSPPRSLSSSSTRGRDELISIAVFATALMYRNHFIVYVIPRVISAEAAMGNPAWPVLILT